MDFGPTNRRMSCFQLFSSVLVLVLVGRLVLVRYLDQFLLLAASDGQDVYGEPFISLFIHWEWLFVFTVGLSI